MMEYFDSGDRAEIEKLQRAAESIEALRNRPGMMEYSQAAREIGVDVFDFRAYPPRRGWLDVNIPQHANSYAIYSHRAIDTTERNSKRHLLGFCHLSIFQDAT